MKFLKMIAKYGNIIILFINNTNIYVFYLTSYFIKTIFLHYLSKNQNFKIQEQKKII